MANRYEWNIYINKSTGYFAEACKRGSDNNCVLMNPPANNVIKENLLHDAVESSHSGDYIVYGVHPLSLMVHAMDEEYFNSLYVPIDDLMQI